MKVKTQINNIHAELDTSVCTPGTNANLTITLYMGIKPFMPKDDGCDVVAIGKPGLEPFRAICWEPSEWDAWKDNYFKAVNSFWNNKLYLINQGNLFSFDWFGKKYIPNINCRINIIPHIPFQRLSQMVEVYRLHDEQESSHGSTSSTVYTNRSTLPQVMVNRMRGIREPIIQAQVFREIGLLLGLKDPSIAAVNTCQNKFSLYCYGKYNYQLNSAVGFGSSIYPEHAQPWFDSLLSIIQIIKMRNGTTEPHNSYWQMTTNYAPPRISV